MFNSEYKKEALAEAERTAEKYSEKYEDTVKKTNVLYEGKKEAISILNHVEEYINSLANKPWEVSKVISESFCQGGAWIFFILLTQILSLLLPE
ncbi:MAG: hypothetical protein KHW67_07830 [Lachnospiraceae bacterium]|nr:hypothetical protein [Lachnospiraceae bacterium]